MSDKTILAEIEQERKRQDKKWGEQNHPSLDQVLLTRKGGCDGVRMCEEYEIPSEHRAKFLCENSFNNKEGTFAHIAVEEMSEAIAALDDAKVREELIQLAAVCVSWIGAIDRRVNNKERVA